jgi:hypothetical protein
MASNERLHRRSRILTITLATAWALLTGGVDQVEAGSGTIVQASTLVFGPDNNAGDRMGRSLARIGDLDGDGIDEFAASVDGLSAEEQDTGGLYILFFDEHGLLRGDRKLTATDGLVPPPGKSDYFGVSLAAIGDIDSDGVPDLAVGSLPFYRLGYLRVLRLNADGSVKASTEITQGSGGFTGTLTDYDNFGSALAALGDLDGDGTVELAVGAARNDDVGSDTGAVWILSLAADGTVASQVKILPDAASPFGTADDGDLFGYSLGRLSDRDGNGVVELAIGAVGDDDGGTNNGAAWIAYLDTSGAVIGVRKISATAGGFTGMLDTYSGFPSAIADPGDVDGDGVEDLLIGASGDDGTSTLAAQDYGVVYVLLLNGDETVASTHRIDFENGGLVLPSPYRANLGTAIEPAGDVDGDGIDEIAFGASGTLRNDGSVSEGGRILFLELATDATVADQRILEYDDPWSRTLVLENGLGAGAAGLGDVSGTGTQDIAVGAPSLGDGGDVLVLLRDTDGRISRYRRIVGEGGLLHPLLEADDAFGASMTAIDDLDTNSIPEIVVGAPGDSGAGAPGSMRGGAWIVYMDADGYAIDSRFFGDGSTDGFSGSLADGDAFGSSATVLGDVDGNGVADVALGAPGDDGAGSDRGAVWVLLLEANGQAIGVQEIDAEVPALSGILADGDGFGTSVASLGDVNGDGTPDLVAGAPGSDTGGSGFGLLVVVFLAPDGSAVEAHTIGANMGGFTGTLQSNERFGEQLVALGDHDGDGIGDVLVGSGSDSPGQQRDSWVLFLAADGSVRKQRWLSGWTGGRTGGFTSEYVASAIGDYDGDGFGDVLTTQTYYGSQYVSSIGTFCGAAPSATCRSAERSVLVMRNKDGTARDSMKWKWRRGDETLFSDFGLDDKDNDYAVCVWDTRDGFVDLVSEAVMPPFYCCGWNKYVDNRLEYRLSTSKATDGIRFLKVRAKEQGKGTLTMKAKGEYYPTPRPYGPSSMFALESDVVVQLVNSHGECWESRFDMLDLNRPDKVKGSVR